MLFMHRNNRFVFQQDNAWSHTACLSTNFLQANNINTLPRPSGSPHLAPIEHVLDMLSRQIRENHHPFKSLQELENVLIFEWNAIPQYKFQQIIRGMGKRCIATITANGAWTIY
jgi:transposase